MQLVLSTRRQLPGSLYQWADGDFTKTLRFPHIWRDSMPPSLSARQKKKPWLRLAGSPRRPKSKQQQKPRKASLAPLFLCVSAFSWRPFGLTGCHNALLGGWLDGWLPCCVRGTREMSHCAAGVICVRPGVFN